LNERRRITLADFPKEWLPKPSRDDQHTLPLVWRLSAIARFLLYNRVTLWTLRHH